MSAIQDVEGHGRRTHVPIDQKHLLLSANSSYAGFNKAVFEHELERAQVSQQRFGERLQLALVNFLFDVMFAHP